MEVRSYVSQLILQIREFSLDHFGKNPDPKIRFSFHPRFRTSLSKYYDLRTRPELFIACFYYIRERSYNEYNHILEDAEIGMLDVDMSNTFWKRNLAAVITHEYAHVIDAYGVQIPKTYKAYSSATLKSDEWGHEASWQYIYRTLRNKFVNNKAYKKIRYDTP